MSENKLKAKKQKLKMKTFGQLKAKWMKDPEFKKEYKNYNLKFKPDDDPDRGLELQDWVIRRIENIHSRKPRKNISLTQMRKKHLDS